MSLWLRMAAMAAAIPVGLAALAGCQRTGSELVVYSAGPRPLAEELCSLYQARTGRKVRLFTATTGQIMAKLEAERFNPRADVVILANLTAALSLKESGRLEPHRPRDLESAERDWHDPDGFFHAAGAAVVGVGVRAGGGADFAGRSWRGLLLEPQGLVMPSPSRSGTAGDFLLIYRQRHPETFWADFLEARMRGLQIVGANSQAITGLLMGAYRGVFAAADYILCREIEKGEPLEVVYPPEGAPYVPRPAAILASSRKKEAAREFVDMLFTREAQQAIATRHLLPARRDVPLSAIRARFEVPRALPFASMDALREQKAVVRRFQYEIERAAIAAHKP